MAVARAGLTGPAAVTSFAGSVSGQAGARRETNPMAKAIVLGGGMVGSVMAADLAADASIEVSIADVRADALQRAGQLVRRLHNVAIDTIEADLADPTTVQRTIEPFDIVLGALASTIGFQTLRAVIEAGKNYCDICFMSENALELHDLAMSHNVTAIVDCGVAPGLSNMLAGFGVAQLDQCEAIEIYVGGIPVERAWPFQYKAGFSPYDVIEEYTRPARQVEHGQIVTREALTEVEHLHFPGLGTLEAFNTDGLRSLIETLDVPFMKEKTMRYPGHAEMMRVLRHIGLFDHESRDIGRQRVRPIDVTTSMLFPRWQYGPGEHDLTVMRVIVRGTVAGGPRTLTWDLMDRFDERSGCTSMSRTTALPCTIVARMILSGMFAEPGAYAPQRLGAEPGLLDEVLTELELRGIHVAHRIES